MTNTKRSFFIVLIFLSQVFQWSRLLLPPFQQKKNINHYYLLKTDEDGDRTFWAFDKAQEPV
ncbi:hypothetical protein DDV21_008110 [Streptococcus chenjunshii]|uniref:Uncharacterized protein n=1 Tax=Streptococcus chenjunshii TaxID=2173853 RepID=A0A372KLJ0_9STRE|nr:hypothetical protein DDV21_008110 [Streptococcus chenjunshii]RFU51247.1 hypothetical protein DDV22_04370 [Streptococcus chenjunshii]RFU53137.1 hypothetical protein DDV23_06030 [Streptococcus chenjunshii]